MVYCDFVGFDGMSCVYKVLVNECWVLCMEDGFLIFFEIYWYE